MQFKNQSILGSALTASAVSKGLPQEPGVGRLAVFAGRQRNRHGCPHRHDPSVIPSTLDVGPARHCSARRLRVGGTAAAANRPCDGRTWGARNRGAGSQTLLQNPNDKPRAPWPKRQSLPSSWASGPVPRHFHYGTRGPELIGAMQQLQRVQSGDGNLEPRWATKLIREPHAPGAATVQPSPQVGF